MIKVISERCPQDHKCPLVRRCRADAIGQESFDAPEVDDKKCVECMICVKNCPYGVFELVEGGE